MIFRTKFVSKFKSLVRDTVGASAVEFGMIIPIVLFAGITTVDLGMGVREHMELDHIVRSTANSAMIDDGEDRVLAIMSATAKKNFQVATDGEGVDEDGYEMSTAYAVNLSVQKFCACPGAPDTEVDCLQICSADEPPNVFYDMTATKAYDSLIVPNLNFSSNMRIQLR